MGTFVSTFGALVFAYLVTGVAWAIVQVSKRKQARNTWSFIGAVLFWPILPLYWWHWLLSVLVLILAAGAGIGF